MVTIILVMALASAIVAASVRSQGPAIDHRLTILLLISYAVRLALSSVTSNLGVFTNMAGDYGAYERTGEIIARYWRFTGIHYVTEIRGEEIASSLPSNLFACVNYLNGESTHMGCTAIVAAVACFVCLEVYLLAQTLGALPNVALGTAALVSALPSFLFYTSNTFKDGFVVWFVIGILGCAIRLSRRFSVVQLALAALFMGGLWLTRFYIVFIIPPPLVLSFLGLRSRSILRVLLAILVIVASVAALYAYSRTPEIVVHRATATFQGATAQNVLAENAEGGSGVVFESTSPAFTFALKFVYTLFSPFPWQSGSLGLQIGKVECLIWYYIVYRAIRVAKVMWKDQRSDLLLFLSLVVPLTVAYAFTFANIGLIARQRMGILVAVIIMASLSWGRREDEEATESVQAKVPTMA